MITGAQVRTARTLLAWSEAELAIASGLPEGTIETLEQGDGLLDGAGHALRGVLEAAGVEFASEERDGVRLGQAWVLHRVAERAEVDRMADGEAKVLRCPEGLRCVDTQGNLLGSVVKGPAGVVSDPDIGARSEAARVTPSDIRAWLGAALKRLGRGPCPGAPATPQPTP